MTDLTAQDAAWVPAIILMFGYRQRAAQPFFLEPDAFYRSRRPAVSHCLGRKREQLLEDGDFLKKLPSTYVMLFDLHGMDERLRTHRDGLPAADFSVFYHLISIERVAISCSGSCLKTTCACRPSLNFS